MGLLTVPLLLIEIVLVMKLSPEETKKQSLRLGVLSGLMILNGYPGESSGDASTRWTYWMLSMLPFCYIVHTLFVGLKESQDAPRLSAIRSSGLAGPPSSRGAPTRSSTSSQ